MNEIMFGVLLGLLVVGLVALGIFVYLAAQEKKFFTAPKEGTAEFVMAGNTVTRMIDVWRGHRQLGYEAAEKECAKEKDPAKRQNPIIEQYRIVFGEKAHNPLNWLKHFGIYWVGIWPLIKIYLYDFTWTEERVDENGKTIPYTRRATKKPGTEGQTAFVRINDTNYFIVADDVKTKSGVPLKFVLLITVRIENPYKALFSGEDWLERTSGTIYNMVIRYAGILEYEEIVASRPAKFKVYGDGEKEMSLEDLIKMLGDGQEDDIQGTDLLLNYGVRIVAAKTHSIEFADNAAAKELRDATTQRYVAKQKGEGEQLQAEGEAKATETRARAEKYRIDTTYEPIAGDNMDARMKIRQLEAVEKSGSQGGNTIVVPDELLGLARKFTEKKG